RKVPATGRPVTSWRRSASPGVRAERRFFHHRAHRAHRGSRRFVGARGGACILFLLTTIDAGARSFKSVGIHLFCRQQLRMLACRVRRLNRRNPSVPSVPSVVNKTPFPCPFPYPPVIATPPDFR